jgi:hypothetical protein
MIVPLALSFSTAFAPKLPFPSGTASMLAPVSQLALSLAQRSARARRSAANVLARLERFTSVSGLCSIVAASFPCSRRGRGADIGLELALAVGLAVRFVLERRATLRRTGPRVGVVHVEYAEYAEYAEIGILLVRREERDGAVETGEM